MTKDIVQMLKDSGVEFVDESHPIYSEGPTIFFVTRPRQKSPDDSETAVDEENLHAPEEGASEQE